MTTRQAGTVNATQDPIITALRSATAAHHHVLERTALMASLMDKDLKATGYATVLCTFARFFATVDPLLEHAASSCSALPASYGYEPRLPFLSRDLSILGDTFNLQVEWQPAPITTLFAHTADPELVKNSTAQRLTDAQTLGLLYVVEGASQGGRIIAPRLAKQLQLNDNNGLSYFHYFAYEASNWAVLRQHLMRSESDSPPPATLKTAEVAVAAQSMFQALTMLADEPMHYPPNKCATHV